MLRVARVILCAKGRFRWASGFMPAKRLSLGEWTGSCNSYAKSIVCEYSCQSANKSISSLLIWGGLFSFFQKKDDKDSELITIIKRAILLQQQGEMKKSEQMFHVALKVAQEQQNHDGVVYVLDNLANLAYELDQYEKAHKLFVSVMQHLLGAGVSDDDNKIIHISLKLADMYQKTGEKSKAEQGYTFCLEKLENKVKSGVEDDDTLKLLAMTLDWYAQFAVDLGHYRDAHNLFKKAYDLSLKLTEPYNEHIVVLLNDLGTVSCLQGDFDGALKYLKEAISLGKNVPEMGDMGSIYINLASVYLKKQMFDEARQACSDARDKARMEKHRDVEEEAEMCLDEIRNYQRAQV